MASSGPRVGAALHPQAGSFRRTLKVEDPSPMDYETFDDVAEGVPCFIAAYDTRRLHSAPEYLGPAPFE